MPCGGLSGRQLSCGAPNYLTALYQLLARAVPCPVVLAVVVVAVLAPDVDADDDVGGGGVGGTGVGARQDVVQRR